MKEIIRKYRKAKGFTLVELLIVIIIIGILAGMMMLASGAATDKAEATKIVSNMRNLKAAVIMYYADTNAWPTSANEASVDKFMDAPLLNNAKDTRYSIENSDPNGVVKVVFTTTATSPDTAPGVITKLITFKDNGTLYSSDDKIFTMPCRQ